jgi:acyl carrier protein
LQIAKFLDLAQRKIKRNSMTETRRSIEEEIAVVLKESGREVPAITDTSALMRGGLGLDSMDFAVLVVRLEQRLGCDPFNSAALEQFPTTVGELAGLYDQTRAKLAA